MGGISLLFLLSSHCSTPALFLLQKPPSLSLSLAYHNSLVHLCLALLLQEKSSGSFQLLYLAGHWLFAAVHQEKRVTVGQGGLPQARHTKATICSKNFPVGGGAGSLTPSPPVTSAASPSNFANLYLLFIYLHTMFLLLKQFLHTCALLAMSAQPCVFQTLHTLALFTFRHVCSLFGPGCAPKSYQC